MMLNVLQTIQRSRVIRKSVRLYDPTPLSSETCNRTPHDRPRNLSHKPSLSPAPCEDADLPA